MRLLFIRFSSIGDIVLTSPAVRCAKQQIPGVEIHFLTKLSMKDLVASNPYIDQCHYLDQELHQTIDALKNISFDYVIDLHHNIRSWKIKNALGVNSFSYKKLSIRKLLLAKLGINLLPATHVCDRYLDTLKPLGVANDGKGVDYFLPANNNFTAAYLPTSHQAGFVAFVIGASYYNKKMPVAKWIHLAQKINRPLVLVGGKEDIADAQIIAQSNTSSIYNACGKFNLQESASIIQMSKLVVSHDTGFLHVAAAFKKPTITIWGATSPALQFEAYYPMGNSIQHYNSLVPHLSCQPCSKQGDKHCPKGHFACMQLQDIDVIASKVNEFLLVK
jgi:ADP-heptose:LPS heptosyltransferase